MNSNQRAGGPRYRYGKGRVPDCYCESNFTCGACLRAAADRNAADRAASPYRQEDYAGQPLNGEERADRAPHSPWHYVLTMEEHAAIPLVGYVDPDRYKPVHRDYQPEMLCRTGNFHARGTREAAQVECPECLERLNGLHALHAQATRESAARLLTTLERMANP